jgi:hypothetical protein
MSKRSDKRRAQAKARASGESREQSGGGVMMSLRGGFKDVASGGQKGKRSTVQKVWDIVFWVLIVAALIFFMSRRFR